MKIKAKSDVYAPLTEERWKAILEKGKLDMENEILACALEYFSENRFFRVFFNNKTAIDIPVNYYKEFDKISDDYLSKAFLSPAGSALCVEEYDLDISIQGLIKDNPNIRFFEVL